MSEAPSRRVVLATWDWRNPAGPGRPQAAGELRRSALVQALVMGGIACAVFFILGHHVLARVIGALAGLVLVLGLAAPEAYRPVRTFGHRLGRAVGTALTYLLLVPFFYLFFTPVAVFLRWRGRDPLHRRYRDPRWTYWIRRTGRSTGENIDRQFLREDRQARGQLRPVGSLDGAEGPERS